jgi:hypothetical protein
MPVFADRRPGALFKIKLGGTLEPDARRQPTAYSPRQASKAGTPWPGMTVFENAASVAGWSLRRAACVRSVLHEYTRGIRILARTDGGIAG